MLTKCLVTPLKLAKQLEWNSRLGKLGAIMCIDISNHQIGLACAYRRKQDPATRLQPDEDRMFPASSATTITPLPPLPYISQEAYHPSYAFLHHNRYDWPSGSHTNSLLTRHFSPGQKGRSLDRVDRSFEIADQLAQIACKRGVHGVLVRWPGDLASTIFPHNSIVEQVPLDDITEDHLTMSLEERLLRGSGTPTQRPKMSDGCQGYLRGRILYLLDKCCTSHGHNKNKISYEPLLVEGDRPFALLDTSIAEQNFTIYHQQSKYSKPQAPRLPKVQDTYGNSFMEADHFGRVPIFGNQPPPPKQGKHYYSSRERYYGYRVSTHFGTDGDSSPTAVGIDRRPNNEPIVAIMEGSLAAMHTLYEFADKYLDGVINLPRWATAAPRQAGRVESNRYGSQAGQELNDSSPERKPPNAAAANTNKAPSTLIQMPKKRTRRRTRQK